MEFFVTIFYLLCAIYFTFASYSTHKAYYETKRFYGACAFIWWLIVVVRIMQMITG